VWIVSWWLNRRDLRRTQQEDVARRQLWDLEEQIHEERLPEEERERRRRYREERAEVRHEARWRLGLPDEEHAS